MKFSVSICIAIVFVLYGCKKSNTNDDTNNGGGNNNGSSVLEILNIPAGYVFWGDTITVTGNGFGSNPADVSVKYLANTTGDFTSQSGNIKIVSVSNTQLRITAPLKTTPGGNSTGPDYAKLVVTVKSKSDTSGNINFVGFPILGSMCYHYGGLSHGATTRPGDSVILQASIQGLNAAASGYMDKLKLFIGTSPVNYLRRTISICSGMAFNLDPYVYCDLNNCTVIPGTIGEPARKRTFRLWIDGTNKETSAEYFILNHPIMSIHQVTGPTSVSQSAGGNPILDITGKFIYISKIKWITNGHSVITGSSNGGGLTNQLQVTVPLSILLANKTYSIVGETNCGTQVGLGSIQVLP